MLLFLSRKTHFGIKNVKINILVELSPKNLKAVTTTNNVFVTFKSQVNYMILPDKFINVYYS